MRFNSLKRWGAAGVAILLVSLMPATGATGNWQEREATSADGTRIAFYVAGNLGRGEIPLFVISGGPGSDHRYMRVGGSFERIAATRPVIMFDQRGTSRSGAVVGAPKLAQWADDVETVRRAADVPKIHILGHSFGGIVAMNYAERYGGQVASIIFANSTAASIAQTESLLPQMFPDRIEEWQRTRAALTPRFKASAIEVFTSMEFVDLKRLDVFLQAIADYTYNIEVNNALRRDMADLDYSDVISNLSVPVLVLHGRYDPVIAPSTAWKLHQQIPGSVLSILPATGHLPFAEVPDAFVEAVAGFLNSAD